MQHEQVGTQLFTILLWAVVLELGEVIEVPLSCIELAVELAEVVVRQFT